MYKSQQCLSGLWGMASPLVQCSDTGLKMRNKKCEVLMHPSNVWESYWSALEIGCLLESYIKKCQKMSCLFAHLLLLFSVLLLEVLVSLHPRGPSPRVLRVPWRWPAWAVGAIRHPSWRSRLGRFLRFLLSFPPRHARPQARNVCLRNVILFSRNLQFQT